MAGGGQPWTVRVATWSARHRWPVAALWFVLTIGLFAVSIAAGGTRSADAVASDDQEETTHESAKAYDVFGASGTAQQDHIFVLLVGDATRTIDAPAFASDLDDVLARMAALTATVDGATTPVFTKIVDPRLVPPEIGLVSPDRTAAQIIDTPATPGMRARSVSPSTRTLFFR